MADSLTSYYSNSGAGVREMKDTIFEDLENMIQTITPHKTPFVSSLKPLKARNVLHEWLEDELKSPTGTNKAIEGSDAVATDRIVPKRMSNYCQILEDSFKISGTLDAVTPAGRKSLTRYEMDKSLKYLNTELEYAALNNAAASAGDSGSARQMKGLEGFVATNDKSFATYASGNDFNEAKFLEMSQACYEAGGEPGILLVGPVQARKVANWNQAGRITVNTNASEQTLVMAVMVLETPFGRMKVTIDRYLAKDDDSGTKYDRVYVYDPDRCSVAYLRPFKCVELAKTGDS
ncbi:SU10 major capsid protein, partial [Fundidesulfovibrio magnetotacticus]|uniref:SU10 major capsid protein n=1 Tax=Fundidesulfovibrio magnetotacticus TaxID=2730080 RepID=UPI001563D71F